VFKGLKELLRTQEHSFMNAEQLQTGTQPKVMSEESKSIPSTNPEGWVEEYGDELYGFALARVRDLSTAKDLVQETFLAGLRSMSSFAGRSNERAWLFGILRNKVVDYYRLKAREAPLAEDDSLGPDEGSFFHAKGPRRDAWVASLAPQAWATPDESLVQKEFQRVFHRCLAQLPDKVSQVFIMKEVDGVASEQICKDLGVSSNNLWVMTHRARMALRRCLELHWFDRRKAGNEKD
jgi:RNA polymerase sigma-70 factor (ECF subfamily)